jgi:hypothetical protein
MADGPAMHGWLSSICPRAWNELLFPAPRPPRARRLLLLLAAAREARIPHRIADTRRDTPSFFTLFTNIAVLSDA